MLVDGDSHFYEHPSLWRDHIDPAEAQLALSVDVDELGYRHLTCQGRRLHFVVPTYPSNPAASGSVRKRRAAGLPCEEDLYEAVPRDYWDVGARAELAQSWGVDHSVLFPQFQGLIDSYLRDELHAARANMRAWNRWAVEVVQQTAGRLGPVGHLRLDGDPGWLIAEIERLGRGGCRFATFVPGLIAGKAPSHPANDAVWRAFTENRVTPIWHITAGYRYTIADIEAWEGENGFGPATGMFLNVGAMLSLSDMIFNGVFDRHRNLHVVLSELGIDWIAQFLAEMDLRQSNLDKQQGRERAGGHRTPSEVFGEHVISVVSCPTDRDIATLLATGGAGLAYGSDYPHGCSSDQPVLAIRDEIKGSLDAAQQSAFLGQNLAGLVA
jgi:predicted TIM-barrel fold metal-dependent hydrolase